MIVIDVSENLQLDSELTLQKAIERVRQAETLREQQQVVRQTESNIEAVRVKQNKGTNKHVTEKSAARDSKCPKFGVSPYHRWYKCPAKNQEEALLRKPAIEALKIITLRIEEIGSHDFVRSYPEVFQGLGKLKEEYHIQLKPGRTICSSRTTKSTFGT